MGREEEFEIDEGWDSPEPPVAQPHSAQRVRTQSIAPDSGDIDAAWEEPAAPSSAAESREQRQRPSRRRRSPGESVSVQNTQPAELPAHPAPALKKARRQLERERRAHEKRRKQERKAERRKHNEAARRERRDRQQRALAEAAERARVEKERRQLERDTETSRSSRAQRRSPSRGTSVGEVAASGEARSARKHSAKEPQRSPREARPSKRRSKPKRKQIAKGTGPSRRDLVLGAILVVTIALIALLLIYR